MTPKSLLIAIACGLAAALLFVSPRSLGVLGLFTAIFTALPLFVSALGFGTLAGGLSGLVACVVIAFFAGPLGALGVALVTLAPAIIIGHFAGLVRNEDGTDEWYPLSRIFTVMVLISAAVVTALLGLSGYSTTAMQADILKAMREVAASFPPESREAMTEEVLTANAAFFAEMIPVLLPASALLVLTINLYLAARIARRSGWMLRPQDDVPSQASLPVFMAGIFAASIIISFFGGGLGLGGRLVAGAFGMGFILVGLATIHQLTKGLQARGAILSLIYLSLFAPVIGQIFGPFVALGCVLIGLADTLLGLRARRAVPPPST